LVNAKFDISEAVGSNKKCLGENFMLIKKKQAVVGSLGKDE